MLFSVARLFVFSWIFLSLWTSADYLRDEDVHLQIYSPPDGKNAIALELIIYNRDEEFFVTIRSEEGKMICQGQFSRFSADRVKCSYDTAILKDGDNSFHVTIRAVATNEMVLDTISHFFYDSNRVVEANLIDDASENWDILIAIVLLLLVYQFGKRAYGKAKSMLMHSTTDAGPPPPPPPSLPVPVPVTVPVTIDDFKITPAGPVSPVTHITHNHYPGEDFLNNNMRLIRAALLGAAIIIGGRAVLGPRRVVPEPVRISYQQAPISTSRYGSVMPVSPSYPASRTYSTQAHPEELKQSSEYTDPGVHIQARGDSDFVYLRRELEPERSPAVGTPQTNMDSRLDKIIHSLSHGNSDITNMNARGGSGGDAQLRSVNVPSLPTRRYRMRLSGGKRVNG